MLVIVQDGAVVVVFVCPHCRNTVLLPPKVPVERCNFCGERVHVPVADETSRG